MEDLLKGLVTSIDSPYALAAYAIGAVVILLAGQKLRMAAILANRIGELPLRDRKRALEIASGTVLPESISAGDWIRLQKLRAFAAICGALVVVVLALIAIALLRPRQLDTARIERNQDLALDILRYRVLSPREFRPSVEIALKTRSRLADFRGLFQIVREQLLETEPSDSALPNGWTIDRLISADRPPEHGIVHVPVGDSTVNALIGGWRHTEAIRLHIVLVPSDSPFAEDLEFAGTSARSDVGIAFTAGRRELLLDPSTEEVTLRISDMSVSEDPNDDLWINKHLETVLDLGAYVLRIGVVPHASSDIVYEAILESDPIQNLVMVALKVSDRHLLTARGSSIQPLEWTNAPLFFVRLPTDREALLRLLVEQHSGT